MAVGSGLNSEVRGGRLVTRVVVVAGRRGVQDAVSHLSSLIHVTDGPGVVGGSAVGIVLVLNLVGNVVEQRLNRAHRTVGVVVRAVSPFHNQHLAWVATSEVKRRRRVGVGGGAHR